MKKKNAAKESKGKKELRAKIMSNKKSIKIAFPLVIALLVVVWLMAACLPALLKKEKKYG